MDIVEREILSDATESDWGLFHTRSSVAKHFPTDPEEAVIDRCRNAIANLIELGLVKLYWLSMRPATEAEATIERQRLHEQLGFRANRDIVTSAVEEIRPSDVEAILADDANWHPPVGWRYVAFEATEAGLAAYYDPPPPI